MADFITKDSGKREEFSSGMVRDTQEDKIRFDLAFDGPLAYVFFDTTEFAALLRIAKKWYDSPPNIQLARLVIDEVVKHARISHCELFREYAELMMRGAIKYTPKNWLKAEGMSELERFKSSFCRHLMQYISGDTSENHKAAIIFNLNGATYVAGKLVGSGDLAF